MTVTTNGTTLGESAFLGCTALTDVDISGCTLIGKSTFRNCASLESIAIPSTVESIGETAFQGCAKLAQVSLHNGAKSIGVSAFADCDALTSICLPLSVTTLGNRAFYGCDALTEALILGPVESFGSEVFAQCVSMTKLVLASGIQQLGTKSFMGCVDLTEVTIPGTVQTVGESAFENCARLAKVKVNSGVKTLGGSVFYNCGALTDVSLADSVSTIGTTAFGLCKALPTIALPQTLTTIAPATFNACTALTHVIIPTSCVTIDDYAFYACTALQEVTIPQGVMSIGVGAFKDCQSLTSVVIPPTAFTIKAEAFRGCGKLTLVVIPENVQKIYDRAFMNCTNLSLLYLPSTLNYLGADIFNSDTELMLILPLNSLSEDYANLYQINYFDEIPLQVLNVQSELEECTVGMLNRWYVNSIESAARKRYTYKLYKDGELFKTSLSFNASYMYTFAEPGTYICEATVASTTASTTITVTSAPIIVRAAASAPRINIIDSALPEGFPGQRNDWTIWTSGGTGALTYDYVLYQNGSVCSTVTGSTSNVFSYTLTAEGASFLQVTATDELGVRSETMLSDTFSIIEPALEYTLLDDGTAQITGVRPSTVTSLTIPEMLDGHAVSALHSTAFSQTYHLSRLAILADLNDIGAGSFSGCAEDFTLVVDRGSYAEQYAKDKGISYIYNQYAVAAFRLSTGSAYACVGDRFAVSLLDVAPAKADPASIQPASSKAKIVRVAQDGTLEALAAGSVQITYSAGDIRKVCTVTVTDQPGLTVPAALRRIDAEAFTGSSGIVRVDLSAHAEMAIGARAFQACESLRQVLLPESVSFEEDVFTGCKALVLFCQTAEQAEYAQAHALPFVMVR